MTTQQHLWSNLRGGLPSALVWCPLQPTGILTTLSISSATALGALSCTPPTSFHRPGGPLSALDLSVWQYAAHRWAPLLHFDLMPFVGQVGSWVCRTSEIGHGVQSIRGGIQHFSCIVTPLVHQVGGQLLTNDATLQSPAGMSCLADSSSVRPPCATKLLTCRCSMRAWRCGCAAASHSPDCHHPSPLLVGLPGTCARSQWLSCCSMKTQHFQSFHCLALCHNLHAACRFTSVPDPTAEEAYVTGGRPTGASPRGRSPTGRSPRGTSPHGRSPVR